MSGPHPLKFEKCPFYLGFLVFLQIYLVVFFHNVMLPFLSWTPLDQKGWIRPSGVPISSNVVAVIREYDYNLPLTAYALRAINNLKKETRNMIN